MIDVADVAEVGVDLLPPEVGERITRRRVMVVTGSLLALWLLGLGAILLVTLASLDRAREERDVAQAEVTRLQGRVTELAPFGQLEARLAEQNTILATAMGEEVSTAAVLNDLALTFPASSSLRTLTLTLQQAVPGDGTGAVPAPAPPAAPSPTPQASEGAAGTDGEAATPAPPGPPVAATPAPGAIGLLSVEGYSTEGYAPGVESVLVQVDQAERIDGPYVTGAQVEELSSTQVTGFSATADISPAAYTDRYRNGLPPQERLE